MNNKKPDLEHLEGVEQVEMKPDADVSYLQMLLRSKKDSEILKRDFGYLLRTRKNQNMLLRTRKNQNMLLRTRKNQSMLLRTRKDQNKLLMPNKGQLIHIN